MASDHYATLGVGPDASDDEIKRAFRGLAREHHPDATGGDATAEQRYKEISEAYAVLSDARKRQEYDAARAGFGGAGGFATSVEDIFESFFGGGTRSQRSRTRATQGESIEVALDVALDEVAFGSKRDLRFQRLERCERCGGDGCEPGSHAERCDRCEGTGQVGRERRTILGTMVTSFACAACSATGWVVPNPCRDCRGAGRRPADVDIPLDVPAGIDDGDRLRIRGEGEAGGAGGPRGDLFVRFVVSPDDRFTRDGDDLVTWAEIPMTTAALGGEVSFESLDGVQSLDVPAGTQSGASFRMRGQGAGRRTGRGRGDLVVRAHVATPTDLNTDQEDLLRKLASARGEDTAEGGGLMRTLRRALGMES